MNNDIYVLYRLHRQANQFSWIIFVSLATFVSIYGNLSNWITNIGLFLLAILILHHHIDGYKLDKQIKPFLKKIETHSL
jgi:hypothetical protein